MQSPACGLCRTSLCPRVGGCRDLNPSHACPLEEQCPAPLCPLPSSPAPAPAAVCGGGAVSGGAGASAGASDPRVRPAGGGPDARWPGLTRWGGIDGDGPPGEAPRCKPLPTTSRQTRVPLAEPLATAREHEEPPAKPVLRRALSLRRPWIVTVVVTVLAVLFGVAVLPLAWRPLPLLALFVLFVAFVVTESVQLDLEVGRQTFSVTPIELVLVIGLVEIGGLWYGVALGAGLVVGEVDPHCR